MSDAIEVTCRQINDTWSTCIQPEKNWKVRVSTRFFLLQEVDHLLYSAALQVSALVSGHAQPRSISDSQ